jgi:hypothetical protein
MTKKSVSYSQYSTYLNCPLSWKLRYVDGYPDTASIDLVFGTAIHEAIQEWLTRLYNGTKVQADNFDIVGFFKERLFVGFDERLVKVSEDGTKEFLTTKETLIEYYLDGQEILYYVQKHAKAWFPTKRHKLIGVEVDLEYPLQNELRYKGYLDIVIFDEINKRYFIYDLKTSKYGWRDREKKNPAKTDQLLLYKKFYSELFKVSQDSITVQFLILRRKLYESKFEIPRISAFEPSHGTPSMKKTMARFESFLTEAFTDTGEPRLDAIKATPGKDNCRFCPFRNDASKCPDSYYLKGSINDNS